MVNFDKKCYLSIMFILYIFLLMFINISPQGHKKNTYDVYRIRMRQSNKTERNRVILVNFFGLPGIEVLHVAKEYTDVKIDEIHNKTFKQLDIFKGDANWEIINKSIYYRIDFSASPKPVQRKVKFLLESEGGDAICDASVISNSANFVTAPFRDYLSYKTIKTYLKEIKRISENVDLLRLGTTRKNRTIFGVFIKSGIMDSTSVFIEGGTLGRDWTSISMALYTIKEIATNISAYPAIQHLDWIIVPVVNPDGYHLSYQDERFKLFAKNRNCFKPCKHGRCGVNIERNFPHYYGGIGASFSPCSHLYLGPSALSEPESRSIQSIMMANRQSLKLYIGLRSFGANILYPWGLKAEPIFDEPELIRVAQAAATAMYMTHMGKLANYTVGNYAKIKYPAAGNIMDFARGVINIKYSYVIYLRGDGDGEKGYWPESTAIFHIIHECFQGIKTLAAYVNAHFPPAKANLRLKSNKRKHLLNSGFCTVINLLLLLLIFLIHLV